MPDLSEIPVRVGATIVGAVLVLLALWWIWSEITSGQRAKTEAKLNRNQVEAAHASGRDAVETLGTQAAVEDLIDTVTKGNADAIRKAPGADMPVAAPVRDAALAGLCKRAAYRDSAQCVQRAATQ